MREPRNPFRLRAAEHIESDLSFLKLFGPGTLDILESGDLWSRPQLFRSAAGGGKTSLLKLLTPSVLSLLHSNRASDDVKDLYRRLADHDIVAESGPRTLGVLLPCNGNYATIEDLDFEPSKRTAIFLRLLNAKLVLLSLRSAVTLAGLVFPEDLHKLTLSKDAQISVSEGDLLPLDGRRLYEWASRSEMELCDAVDAFDAPDQKVLLRQDRAVAIEMLQSGGFLAEGRPVAERSIIMFDDVHLLSTQQRSTLRQTFAQRRSTVSVWIAERCEALTPDELLSPGVTRERDYDVVHIEQFWRKHKKKFHSLVFNVADRRARAATEVEFASFEPYLVSSLDGADQHDKAKAALEAVEARVRRGVAGDAKYEDWLNHEDLSTGTTFARAIEWRTLEILIYRERRRAQQTFDFVLSTEELEEKSDSQVRAAAELFLSKEFKFPYYFGPSRLAALAASNLEQFLWLAGDQFEELAASAVVRGSSLYLSPVRQEFLVRRASLKLWKDIRQRTRYGEHVYTLLDSTARFCRDMTFLPNAPYDPGVTGIAISMSDRGRLLNADYVRRHPEYRVLSNALGAAIASNLLEPVLDYKCKGQLWMVLNLNRLLCPQYWLPLHYGGFKEKSLDELLNWATASYQELML